MTEPFKGPFRVDGLGRTSGAAVIDGMTKIVADYLSDAQAQWLCDRLNTTPRAEGEAESDLVKRLRAWAKHKRTTRPLLAPTDLPDCLDQAADRIEALEADFNDVNAERKRWKDRATAAELALKPR